MFWDKEVRDGRAGMALQGRQRESSHRDLDAGPAGPQREPRLRSGPLRSGWRPAGTRVASLEPENVSATSPEWAADHVAGMDPAILVGPAGFEPATSW